MLRPFLALSLAAGAAGIMHFHAPNKAEACGCFVPPDPTVPIVQAGERILFGMENGEVTAHIQVQYSGAASEFGWLLPMPSVPEMELGSDELFAQLINSTQPTYRLDKTYQGDCAFDPNRQNFPSGEASDSGGEPESAPGQGGGSPLVLRDTVGPFDFAVLRADAKKPMLDWLSANDFFVPAGTDSVVDTYIKPDAYFLALKLRSGEDTGDLQPVVLKYKSDLPMIPIILTSVAADPNMGVQVWVLGEDRAIPRNYHHTRINDAALDWLNFAANYTDVVTDAVDEISGHHAFVTEYAGPSDIAAGVLDYDGRFGNEAMLAARTTAIEFIEYINNNGYVVFNNQGPFGFAPAYPALALNILQNHFPVPPALLSENITPAEYYWQIGYFQGEYRQQFPEKFPEIDPEFSSTEVARELHERIVEPTLAAGKILRDHRYLTRLFTTLSPNEMTKDPVFSFNPDLPDFSNVHSAELAYRCDLLENGTEANTPAILTTEQGFEIVYAKGVGDVEATDAPAPWAVAEMPQSHYQEIVREEGDPEIVQDNTNAIQAALRTGRTNRWGCSTTGTGSGSSPLSLSLLALAFLALRRRRINQ